MAGEGELRIADEPRDVEVKASLFHRGLDGKMYLAPLVFDLGLCKAWAEAECLPGDIAAEPVSALGLPVVGVEDRHARDLGGVEGREKIPASVAELKGLPFLEPQLFREERHGIVIGTAHVEHIDRGYGSAKAAEGEFAFRHRLDGRIGERAEDHLLAPPANPAS